MTENEWIKLIGGGFAGMTAPFAVHPNDRRRANEYLLDAQAARLSISDAKRHARLYLKNATGWPTDIDEQIRKVEDFFNGKLT